MSDDITVTVILSTGSDPGNGIVVGINHAAGEELGDITMNPDVNGDSLRAAIAGMTLISQGARERLAGRFGDGMGGLEFDDRMRVVATDRQVDRLAASLFLQNLQLLALARGEQPPLTDPEKAWGTADEEMKDMTRDMARIMLGRVRKAEP
ncbi:hypothetical protein [Bifidobacterium thermophilum]|uniref:Uncharacterized protein n=1 Tax=Bifidobacterium thermophilum TaxID=33905 RepID=A0A7X9NQA5_9BIFI|nr:hypothetical protein [Bifidobacterium thermophilum]NME61838.1 hypothetical protein [Bifidobacterium thermophilum]